jgi:serine protease Do
MLLVLTVAGVPVCEAAPTKEAAAADLALLRNTSKAFTSVAQKAVPAVVFITVEKTLDAPGMEQFNDPFGFFGDEFFERFFRGPRARPRRFRQQGQGSGFLVSKDGYILTNNHVVGDADKITVKLHDGKEYPAKRIGSDPRSEVAVIKIEEKDLPFVEMGDSAALEVGEWVIAIGNPFGLAESVTVGIVSAKGRRDLRIAEYEDFIQTDAAINPGNSGGPLLNIEGKAVGINTAIFSQSGGYMGIGFAIPINMAKAIKDQLISTGGKLVRGYLGVVLNRDDMDDDMAKSFGLKKAIGALVTRVLPGSPAEKAGVKDEDVILRINGAEVESNSAFRNTVAFLKPGTQVKLVIFRDGKETEKDVVLGTLPEDTETASAGAGAPDVADKLGLSVQDLTSELARRYGYAAGEGVLVADVASGSPAHRAGIQPGQVILSVNRERTTSVKDFSAALAKAEKAKRVLLRVRNQQDERFVILRLD